MAAVAPVPVEFETMSQNIINFLANNPVELNAQCIDPVFIHAHYLANKAAIIKAVLGIQRIANPIVAAIFPVFRQVVPLHEYTPVKMQQNTLEEMRKTLRKLFLVLANGWKAAVDAGI